MKNGINRKRNEFGIARKLFLSDFVLVQNTTISNRLTSYVPWLVPRLKGQINTNLSQWNFYLGDVITITSLIFLSLIYFNLYK